MNAPSTRSRVFQIAYEALELPRAELLRQLGCQVVSALGNEEAKVLLSSIEPYDLFIVGYAAPIETRGEIVHWLKENYPGVKILALNPSQEPLLAADYNVKQTDPETWLRIATQGKQTPLVAGRQAVQQGMRSYTRESTNGGNGPGSPT